MVLSKTQKVEVIFLKLHHSGVSRWEFIYSGSAPTYTEPVDLNRPLETLRGFQHESKSQKKGWQIPRVSDPLAELLVARGSLERMALCLLKSKEEPHLHPKDVFIHEIRICNVFTFLNLRKNHQVNCLYKITKQVSILYLM